MGEWDGMGYPEYTCTHSEVPSFLPILELLHLVGNFQGNVPKVHCLIFDIWMAMWPMETSNTNRTIVMQHIQQYHPLEVHPINEPQRICAAKWCHLTLLHPSVNAYSPASWENHSTPLWWKLRHPSSPACGAVFVLGRCKPHNPNQQLEQQNSQVNIQTLSLRCGPICAFWEQNHWTIQRCEHHQHGTGTLRKEPMVHTPVQVLHFITKKWVMPTASNTRWLFSCIFAECPRVSINELGVATNNFVFFCPFRLVLVSYLVFVIIIIDFYLRK